MKDLRPLAGYTRRTNNGLQEKIPQTTQEINRTMPTPTPEMRRNAKRALKLREQASPSQRGMTPVGLARANQFAKGESVSIETVRRTLAFLTRARTYYQPGKNTPGTQAYLGWGGLAGLVWAKRILAEIKSKGQ